MLETQVTVAQLPAATPLTGIELMYGEQGGNPVKVTTSQIAVLAQGAIPAARTKTRAEILALRTASGLASGQFYLCTDATTADQQLILLATAVNEIDFRAYSPSFEQDVIMYDIVNDVIKYRWDTISDISVYQDLRNLTGLTIGTSCVRIHLESGVTGSIGNNCTDIKVGANSTISIGANSSKIKTGANCGLTLGTGCNRIELKDEANVTLGGSCGNSTFDFQSTVTGGDSCGNIYVGQAAELTLTEGGCTFIYIGSAADVTLGDSCTNINIGTNSTVTLGSNASNNTIGNSCNITGGAEFVGNQIGNVAQINVGNGFNGNSVFSNVTINGSGVDDIIANTFYSECAITIITGIVSLVVNPTFLFNFSNPAWNIYTFGSPASLVLNTSNDPFLIYVDGSGNVVTLQADI